MANQRPTLTLKCKVLCMFFLSFLFVQNKLIWPGVNHVEEFNSYKQGLNQLSVVVSGSYDCVSTLQKYRSYQKVLSATARLCLPLTSYH